MANSINVGSYPGGDIGAQQSSGAVSFPTQYLGLKVYDGGIVDLCLVATADAPAGVGGQLRIRKGGTTYAAYLVSTGDSNASNARIKTSTGTYAIRKYTA